MLAHLHIAGFLAQSGTVTGWADTVAHVLGQFFPYGRRFGFAITPFEIGNDPLEGMCAYGQFAAFVQILEGQGFITRAVENDLPGFFR